MQATEVSGYTETYFLFSVDELDSQLSNWLAKVQRIDGPVRALIAP